MVEEERTSDKSERWLQMELAFFFFGDLRTSPLLSCLCPEQKLNSLAAQLFTALVSLARTQRRMYGDGSRE